MAPTVTTKEEPHGPVNRGHNVVTTAPDVLNAGSLQLDHRRRCAIINDKMVALAPNELSLLRCLLEARGRVVSRALLFENITAPGRTRLPKLQSVDVHIKRIRQKLGPAGHSIITVRNVGYRFEICREWINQETDTQNTICAY
ncbi:MAG: winged helix family transcriptional regulator [Rhodospirillaceae bacterium]|nr:MAG: winged helix family transcriptional regulator [Rhodospirillaceae bacterium]